MPELTPSGSCKAEILTALSFFLAARVMSGFQDYCSPGILHNIIKQKVKRQRERETLIESEQADLDHKTHKQLEGGPHAGVQVQQLAPVRGRTCRKWTTTKKIASEVSDSLRTGFILCFYPAIKAPLEPD